MILRNWAGLSTLSLCPKISLFQYVTKNGQRTVVRQVEGGKRFLHVEWQRYFGISSLNNSSWGKLGQRSGKLWHGEARVGRFLLYLIIQELWVSKEPVRGWLLEKQQNFQLCKDMHLRYHRMLWVLQVDISPRLGFTKSCRMYLSIKYKYLAQRTPGTEDSVSCRVWFIEKSLYLALLHVPEFLVSSNCWWQWPDGIEWLFIRLLRGASKRMQKSFWKTSVCPRDKPIWDRSLPPCFWDLASPWNTATAFENWQFQSFLHQTTTPETNINIDINTRYKQFYILKRYNNVFSFIFWLPQFLAIH